MMKPMPTQRVLESGASSVLPSSRSTPRRSASARSPGARPRAATSSRGAAGAPRPARRRAPRPGEQSADEDHRAEHVQEEREVPAVGPDAHAHAPGFQIMSMRIRTRRPLATVCRRSPRGVRFSASSSVLGPSRRRPAALARGAARARTPSPRAAVAAAIAQSTIAAITQPSHDLVRVERDREPDAEDDRPERADDRPRRCRHAPRAEPIVGPGVSIVARGDDQDPEDHEGADERERAEQVEREDPVVQLHVARLWDPTRKCKRRAVDRRRRQCRAC